MTRAPAAARAGSPRRLAAAVLAGLAGLAGCGSGGPGVRAAPQILVGTATLPATVDGLTVASERLPGTVRGLSASYVDTLNLFTFRKATNVQATLEIAHFARSAPVGSAAFQSRIANAVLVAGVPRSVLVDGTVVQQASALKSEVSEWILEDRLYVLTVLQSYPHPRDLLDAVLRTVHP